MGPLQCVTPVQVESLVFPPLVKPLGSSKTLFLGGAGARGLEIQGKFVKFTAIGVYLEEQAVPLLSLKWKGKSGPELTDAVDFFRDVVTGACQMMIVSDGGPPSKNFGPVGSSSHLFS